MKTFLLTTTALVAFAAVGTAGAADLIAPPTRWVPAFSWTGFYIGFNAGGEWNDNNFAWAQPAQPLNGFINTTATGNSNNNGNFIGGAQAGYNWQVGAIVLGVEGDINYRHWTASSSVLPFAAFGNTIDQLTVAATENWVGTIRPRVGIAASNWLFYVTGGLAGGEVEHSYTETRITVPGQTLTIADSAIRAGWVAGAGIEWAPWKDWSWGIEYLHIDLGSTTLSQPVQTVNGLIFPASQATYNDRSDIVRAKANYRFYSESAVAKY